MQQVTTSQRQWRLVRQASIAGVHPQLVQEVMRHSTYTTTAHTYAHVMPGHSAEAVGTVAALFRPPMSDRSTVNPDDAARGAKHAGGWFPATQARLQGHIRAGGVDKDVMFADADPDLNDAIDAAYRDKYRRYGERSIAGVVNPEARAATIKLMPR